MAAYERETSAFGNLKSGGALRRQRPNQMPPKESFASLLGLTTFNAGANIEMCRFNDAALKRRFMTGT